MLAKTTAVRHVLAFVFLLFVSAASAQKKVSGKVTGPDSKPVFGASVTAKGTNVTTSTSSEGFFTIEVPSNVNTLVITYIGFETIEVNVSGKETVDVSMKEQTTNLNEVVVTGYSTQRKKDITGAVTVVNVAQMKAQPTSDPSSQLQGRASGVTIVQNNIPGAEATVRIRGLGSFNNNSPLFVVDGVQTGSISGLNPNDIESMQVLKDAASASIYGVRGSNGVIIVTTKKGRKRGVNLSYDMYYGSQNPGKGFDLLNAQEEANLIFLARKNSGLSTSGSIYGNGTTPVLPDYLWAGLILPNGGLTGVPILSGNPAADPAKYQLDYSQLGDAGYRPYIIVPTNKSGTNWYDVITRNAPIQSHNLTLGSSTENARVLLSMNYFDQQAITKYNFFKRYTVRLNSEFNIASVIRIGENLQVFSSEANASDNNQEAAIIAQTFRPLSILPVYTIKDGDFAGNVGSSGFGFFGNGKNPLAILHRNKDNRSKNINLFGNVYAEIDLFKHFTLRSSFGGTINTNNSYSYPFYEYENQENSPNLSYNERFVKNNLWIWTNQLSYKNNFGKHSVSAVVGEEAQKGTGRQLIGNATGYYAYNYLPFINLTNGSVQNLNGSVIYTPGSTLSYFAKADYSFDGKYLLSALVRRDGSSKFLAPNKWGTFPAFSLGWRISEESFMKDIRWLNDLKLRGSWGKLGNEAAASASNAFTTFASARGSSWYDLSGTQGSAQEGFYLSFVGNPVGRWEKSVTSNIGFDAVIFNNSTEIVFDWYNKTTQDLLYNPAVQAIAGAAAANNPSFKNVGSMKNSGIDLMINNKSRLTRDLILNTALTFTTYKNKITAITNDGQPFFDFNSPIGEANRIGGNITRNFVGESINTFFGYQVVGLFQDAADVTKSPAQSGAAPGRFKYADINGDKVIDDKDRTIIGNPNPKFSYGLNLEFDYKGFDLTAFFYGVAGKESFNYTKWWTDFSGGFPGGRSKRALYDSWLPDGSRPNAKTPIQEAGYNGTSLGGAVNSYYVEKSSYFRLRNLQIGYTLPLSVINKAKLSKVRVYLQGTNLFTITKYSGLDPEILTKDDRAAGIDGGIYPTVRQFLLGASINF
jgi:TonB-linked SusC/RagA family outer membrane protein